MKPKHIAIIMDGNRRWAKSNNYSLLEAYEQGLETLNDTIAGVMMIKIETSSGIINMYGVIIKTYVSVRTNESNSN